MRPNFRERIQIIPKNILDTPLYVIKEIPDGKPFTLEDWIISHHNTTLKEIEEEVGKLKNKWSGITEKVGFSGVYKLAENELKKHQQSYNMALDDIKQLIHQKLIK